MRVYVSGPMTGIADDNKPAFRAAAYILREMGHEPLLPCDVCGDVSGRAGDPPDWHDCIAADIRAMADAESICYLPGHERSYGCRVEAIVAERMGLPVVDLLRTADRISAEETMGECCIPGSTRIANPSGERPA